MEHQIKRTVEVNCKGAMNAVAAVLPGMLERGRGHVVTISSDAGRKVFPGLALCADIQRYPIEGRAWR